MNRRNFIKSGALFVPTVLTARKSFSQKLFDPNLRIGATVALSAKVSAWAARVVANGGALPSQSTQIIVDTYYQAIVSAGLDSLMISDIMMVPDSVIAATTPLYNLGDKDPWQNFNFVVGDLTTNGLQGNATNKYLNTGCAPTIMYSSANDAGFSFYSSDATSLSMRMNSINGANDVCGLYADGLNMYLGAYNTWDITSSAITNQKAFCSASRTASNAAAIYQASSSLGFLTKGTTSGSPGTRPALYMYAFCWSFNGTPTTFSAGPISASYASVHHGLTSGQTQSLYNAVQAMRVSFGGGYA